MASRNAARRTAAILFALGSTGALLTTAGPAQAQVQPPPGQCATTFAATIEPGYFVAAYNYTICPGPDGAGIVRTSGYTIIEKNHVTVNIGETDGEYTGVAYYACNGTAVNSFYLYGPDETVSVACG
jgi:hypothetical protein